MEPCCSHAATHRLATSVITRNYRPLRELTKYLVSQVKIQYPEAIEMLLDYEHPVYEVQKVLPVLPFSGTPSPKQFLAFEVIDGSLDLHAVALSVSCNECQKKGHIVAINARFWALCHHFFYAAMSGNYEDARMAWVQLSNDTVSYQAIPFPPTGPWSERILHGIAWIMFHEFGHVVHRSQMNNFSEYERRLASIGSCSRKKPFSFTRPPNHASTRAMTRAGNFPLGTDIARLLIKREYVFIIDSDKPFGELADLSLEKQRPPSFSQRQLTHQAD